MDRLLETLGLHRKELRAWAMYDWANSAFVTTIMGAVLPVYFVNVSASTVPGELRTAYWGYTQTVALVIALTSPFLGAAADFLGATKKFLAAFALIGATGAFLLFFAAEPEA